MMWSMFLIVSIVILLFSLLFAVIKGKTKYKSGSIFDPFKILFIGVIFSSLALFFPIYYDTYHSSGCGVFETVLISIHSMIKLFIVDSEFELIASALTGASQIVFKGYVIISLILFVLAPVLTFGFVLSFFKNVSAYTKYIAHYNSDVYVFSELNEKSLALAESLYNNDSCKRLLVFTDVFETESEQRYEFVEKAKEIGAICFKKDIITIDFTFHSSQSELNFFAIGDDQSKNISQALKIIDKLKYRKNTNLYVFSTLTESEILLVNAFDNDKEGVRNSTDDKHISIKVRRVNEVRSLINRNLYQNGYEKIYCGAFKDDSEVKKINAVIIGMGQHGTEMTKALSWFCQMDGYDLEINSFDEDCNARDRFVSLCPELMELSGKKDIPGESKYTISVHSGVDVDTITFDNIIKNIPRTTYVFVALGNDEKNISTAVKLRTLFERMNCNPVIQAVVYDSQKKDALTDIKNFKGSPYNIDFIGDLKSSYSEDVILHSDIEAAALERHLKWGNDEAFWRYDYNYKSSIASAIHRKMKILCGIPGIDKEPGERTDKELWNLRILEHCRWNAYMRSEGYVYGGTVEKSGRNDLAKTHNCLVPFDELPLEEQIKDDD